MNPQNPNVFLPAEWHPQSGLQLTWPHERTDWRPYLDEARLTFEQLAEAVATHERLIVVTPHCGETAAELKAALTPRAFANVSVVHCATHDTWARDHGPISLIGPTNVVCDFTFNGWGEKFPWKTDNAITARLFKAGLFHAQHYKTDFVLEGGSIESDGQGTLLTTSTCLLAPHRNQPLTREQIEQRLKATLHVERVLWLDHGNVVGDDTDGHVDTIVRMAPDDTLLYMRVDDEADPMFADFQALERQLHTLRTLSGKPYRLLPLPTPRPILYDGERLPATYANFVIINGAVIVPTYQQPDHHPPARLPPLPHHAISRGYSGSEPCAIDDSGPRRQVLSLRADCPPLPSNSKFHHYERNKNWFPPTAQHTERGGQHHTLGRRRHRPCPARRTAHRIAGTSQLALFLPRGEGGQLRPRGAYPRTIHGPLWRTRQGAWGGHRDLALREACGRPLPQHSRRDRQRRLHYRKMHIPDDPGYYEKFYFTPGDLGFHPISTSLGRLGVLVCWDQWYPEAARLMALQGAEILIYPTAIGYDAHDTQEEQQRQREAWTTVMRGHAVANGLPVVAVNRVGFEPTRPGEDPDAEHPGIVFWGSSFVCGPQGEMHYRASTTDEESVIVSIDLDHSESVRRWWPFLRDRRIDAYQDITKRYI